MADLGAFARDAKTVKKVEAERRASGERAKRRAPGEAPSGYRQDIWTLAIRFQKYALADQIELVTDLPIIHDTLNDLVDRHAIRGRTFSHRAEGCPRRHLPEGLAERCWYHYPPHDPDRQQDCALTWEQTVEVVMAEFWSRIWDEHALDHFRQHFLEYGGAAVRHWRNLGIAREIRAKDAVADRPPVMRRATMAAATKEG